MKKFLSVFISFLSLLMVFSLAACGDGEEPTPAEIDQWEYFDQYVNYTQYEYLEEAPSDWSRNRITNSNGEVQQNCWDFVGNFGDVSVKDSISHSDLDYYSRLRISRKSNAKSIVMTKLSIMIYAEADCTMIFSLSVKGDETPRSTVTVSAVANTNTELLFEQFAEYTWSDGSSAQITITLENPNAIGNVKYGFSNLVIALKYANG